MKVHYEVSESPFAVACGAQRREKNYCYSLRLNEATCKDCLAMMAVARVQLL